jgi:hypothetical protein
MSIWAHLLTLCNHHTHSATPMARGANKDRTCLREISKPPRLPIQLSVCRTPRLPAPSALIKDGSAELSATDEPPAGSSRQLHVTERGPARDAVVDNHFYPPQRSGSPKPKATGSGMPEHAASPEAEGRCLETSGACHLSSLLTLHGH